MAICNEPLYISRVPKFIWLTGFPSSCKICRRSSKIPGFLNSSRSLDMSGFGLTQGDRLIISCMAWRMNLVMLKSNHFHCQALNTWLCWAISPALNYNVVEIPYPTKQIKFWGGNDQVKKMVEPGVSLIVPKTKTNLRRPDQINESNTVLLVLKFLSG